MMMRFDPGVASLTLTSIALLTACDLKQLNSASGGDEPKQEIAERIDKEEALEAIRLQAVSDPVGEKVAAYHKQMADYFYAQNFDALEKEAAAARTSKEVFGNGSWKIVQFYGAFDRDNEDALGIWNVTEETHLAWLKAKPDSLTAHIAYADFLVSYAWHARGTGYADTVTEEGLRLMQGRLVKALEVLGKARELPETDPMLNLVALSVALGLGPEKAEYDKLVDAANAAEPTFWGYDRARAYSLLPRWYGEKGDWEAYAANAVTRPGSLGPEVYARIVMNLVPFHQNIFKESKASWPKTKEGLDALRTKYPESVEILSYAAFLATCAFDNKSAKAYFEELGDRYLEDSVWPSKESFVHYRKWARTGKW